MRVKLKLKQNKSSQNIPINYQYPVSSFIYRTIENSSNEYSRWLHNSGHISGSKKFKLFTFSILNIPQRTISGNFINIISDEIELTVSILSDKTVEHFIIGMFENQKMKIYDQNTEAEFSIKTVEMIPEPDFKRIMKFKTISPIVLSKRTIHKGKESMQYMSPEDEDYKICLQSNLSEKFNTFYKTENKKLKIDSFNILSDIKSKLIIIKEDRSDETRVRGFVYKFSIEGDTELLKIGYKAGFGKSCSLGFGCVEAVRQLSS